MPLQQETEKDEAIRRKCLPEKVRPYITAHLRDDAENHRAMTTESYKQSHEIMWGIIDWPTWVKLMETQAKYSELAVELIENLPTCDEMTDMLGKVSYFESGGKAGED